MNDTRTVRSLTVTTGIGSDALQMITLACTNFTCGDAGYLEVWLDDEVVAVFSPGWTWAGYAEYTNRITP